MTSIHPSNTVQPGPSPCLCEPCWRAEDQRVPSRRVGTAGETVVWCLLQPQTTQLDGTLASGPLETVCLYRPYPSPLGVLDGGALEPRRIQPSPTPHERPLFQLVHHPTIQSLWPISQGVFQCPDLGTGQPQLVLCVCVRGTPVAAVLVLVRL